jgi:aspartate racemase
MKPLGMIGGLGPESTVDYYRCLVEEYRERTRNDSYPPILINSIDLQKARWMVEQKKYAELSAYLVEEVERLANAGAVLGFLSANTPHIVFDEVRERCTLPLVSIVEAACQAAKELGYRRLGLIGTAFTMQARFFPEVFARAGMSIAVPTDEEQQYIHEKYLNELVKGAFLPETRSRVLQIVEAMKLRDQIDAIILGGTELPLLLTDASSASVPLLDTTRIHVKAILSQWLGTFGGAQP